MATLSGLAAPLQRYNHLQEVSRQELAKYYRINDALYIKEFSIIMIALNCLIKINMHILWRERVV